jgi:hypothetical protein
MPAHDRHSPARPRPSTRLARALGDRIGDLLGGWLPAPPAAPAPVRSDDGPRAPLPGPRRG